MMDDVDDSAAVAAMSEFASILAGLDPVDREAQSRKFLTMFDQYAGTFFFAKWELRPAGATYDIASAKLYPTQRFLDIIAAVRAGNLDWYVELSDGAPSHPSHPL